MNEAGKNIHAQELGRLGGLARAKKLSKIEIIDIARKAGRARWKKQRTGQAEETPIVKLV